MKYPFLYLFLLMSLLYTACCGRTPQSATVPSDSACSVSLVKDLLKWYAKKYDSIDSLQLVTMPESEDSGWNVVNFNETARYLQTLKSSGFFTEKFLADKAAYFRKCDTNLGTFDNYLLFTVKTAGDTCRVEDIQYRTDPDSAADVVFTHGADTTEPLIRKIKKEYDRIQADSAKFRVVSEDLMDQSTEGGDATRFYEGNDLRKAVIQIFGEMGRVTNEYYFINGQLFFFFSRDVSYTKPFYIGNSKTGQVGVTRCYFENRRLVRWIDEKGKTVDKVLYPAKEKELLDDVKDSLR